MDNSMDSIAAEKKVDPQDFARERVQRGAILLDAIRPGWEHEIEVSRLKQDKWDRCVLGQLFGDFIEGIKVISEINGAEYDDSVLESRLLGFYAVGEHGLNSWDEYSLLDEAWRELIERRLFDAQQVQP